MDAQKIVTPTPIATEGSLSADAAIVRLEEIYERNTAFLRERFDAYARLDSRLSYGFVSRPGVHQATLTRPDLFRGYYTEQVGLLAS